MLLVHNHLPKLDDYGIIQWDHKSRTVTEGEWFGVARSLLNPVPNDSCEKLSIVSSHVGP